MDNFEAGVVIACNDDPSSASGNTAQPPPGDSGDNNNTSPTTVPLDSGGNNNQPSGSNQPSGPEGDSGNSWYDLNVYEYTPSYTTASSNGILDLVSMSLQIFYCLVMDLIIQVVHQNLTIQFLYQQMQEN